MYWRNSLAECRLEKTKSIHRSSGRGVASLGGAGVRVKLVDYCACGGGRLLDLYASAFSRLAPLSRGVLPVEVTW
jgi:hypothetical protein